MDRQSCRVRSRCSTQNAEVTITGIEGWALDLPMRHRFTTRTSRLAQRRIALVRLRTGDVVGWGEAAPVPGHSRDDFAAVWQQLRDRAGELVGSPAADSSGAATGLAGAALRSAAADAAARSRRQPLWAYLGGERDPVACAAVGVADDGSPEPAEVRAAAAAGYRHLKLKVTPTTTVRQLAAVITRHPDIRFSCDANGDASRDLLFNIDELGVEFIEQPLAAADLAGHAELRQRVTTPIAVDESADSESAIRAILDHGAADIVVLKVGRFGTLGTARLAGEIAAAGIRCRLGGLVESGVGKAHSVAVASLSVFDSAADLTGSSHFFLQDLTRPEWKVEAGLVKRPQGPGIGVNVDEGLVSNLAFDRFEVGGAGGANVPE